VRVKKEKASWNFNNDRKREEEDLIILLFKKYVIASEARQSPHLHIEREEIASSSLLAMTCRGHVMGSIAKDDNTFNKVTISVK